MEGSAVQALSHTTLQYQWSSALPRKMSAPSSVFSAPTTCGAASDDHPQGVSLDAGMNFLGGHRTRPNWTPQEDLTLLQHVARHGTRNWGSLQNSGLLPLRDQKACCNRFILLKKRCIKDKRSLSHLLQRAKEAVLPAASTPGARAASAAAHLTNLSGAQSGMPQLSLPVLSSATTAGLGVNSQSRLAFKGASMAGGGSVSGNSASVSLLDRRTLSMPSFESLQSTLSRSATVNSTNNIRSSTTPAAAAAAAPAFGFSASESPIGPSSPPPPSVSDQLANLKSRLALRPGSLLAQTLRLSQDPSAFSSVYDLPFLANVHHLTQSSISASPHSPSSSSLNSPTHSFSPSAASDSTPIATPSRMSSLGRAFIGASEAASAARASHGGAFNAFEEEDLDPIGDENASFCHPSFSALLSSPYAAAGLLKNSQSAPATSAPEGLRLPSRSQLAAAASPRGSREAQTFGSEGFEKFVASANAAVVATAPVAVQPPAVPSIPAAPAFSHTWKPQGNARCMQLQQQQQEHQQAQPSSAEPSAWLAMRPDALFESFASSSNCVEEYNDAALQRSNHDTTHGTDGWMADTLAVEPENTGVGFAEQMQQMHEIDQQNQLQVQYQQHQQQQQDMFSSTLPFDNTMFSEMAYDSSETDMLQAIHAEMELLNCIMNTPT